MDVKSHPFFIKVCRALDEVFIEISEIVGLDLDTLRELKKSI
ncbi:hypothetical protein [uncultured Holdemanella sp.]|nr:hypothetical protein [uncultured Holdemanella sp.]